MIKHIRKDTKIISNGKIWSFVNEWWYKDVCFLICDKKGQKISVSLVNDTSLILIKTDDTSCKYIEASDFELEFLVLLIKKLFVGFEWATKNSFVFDKIGVYRLGEIKPIL